ncbi:MAG: nickel pincer cofactor biosynthesis protein LarC [Pseudomonadota bacterium]
MKCLYIDCFAGISGDMMLGALIDLGVPQNYLKTELKKLGVSGYAIHVTSAMKMGISGRHVQVKKLAEKKNHHHNHHDSHHHRSYKDIEAIIYKSSLASPVKEKGIDIFYRIAQAEAKVHKKTIEDIHFHEVGAIDSIVDIVGSVIGINFLGAEKFYASSVPLGGGFVQCQHGTLPVPAPATLLLLKGIPVYDPGIKAELVTPTGAAILTSLASGFGNIPPMTILKTGYGAGTRELKEVPNMLRLILGETKGETGEQQVWILEANIDDMNPEWTGYVMERLFAAGALDVLLVPAYMKKNRPGVLFKVICSETTRAELTRIMFQETTTTGVRAYRAERTILPRKEGKLKTRFGCMKVKVFNNEQEAHAVPEFEECRRVAMKEKISLKEVYEEVIAAAKKK